jgi:hypothetical protein
MNRRDILQVLGIGAATGIAGTESITARAASMDPEHMNHPDRHGLYPGVPQIDKRGAAKQHAIADALEALAMELRISARAEEARKGLRDRKAQLVAEARAMGVENPSIELPKSDPIDEVWAISLATHSKIDGEFLGHQIVIDVELLHAS